MKPSRPTVEHTSIRAAAEGRRLRMAALITLVVATAVSAALGLGTARRHQDELALAVARSFFEETVALRSWVSEQGGLYVPASDDVPPNPFLPPEQRELVDQDGGRHVMLNPAYLTRLLASRTEQGSGVSIRLIDSAPLNPDNVADGWEAGALVGLDAPGIERWEVVQQDGERRFRYLSTLEREPSCVAGCHAAARDRPGGALGAISVGLDYAPFDQAVREQAVAVLAGHALVLTVALLVLWFLGRRLDARLHDLRAAGERIGSLERLLPICAWCKKIRPGEEEDLRWVQVEDYVSEHAQTEFTHGMCPDCASKLLAEGLSDRVKGGVW